MSDDERESVTERDECLEHDHQVGIRSLYLRVLPTLRGLAQGPCGGAAAGREHVSLVRVGAKLPSAHARRSNTSTSSTCTCRSSS